jgi:hypothetical protein
MTNVELRNASLISHFAIQFEIEKLCSLLQRTVIVAMSIMRMVQVPTDEIVEMVAVRCAFVPAIGSVNMILFVSLASVIGRTGTGVEATY